VNLSQRQWQKVLAVIQQLSDGLDDAVVRERAGHNLLDLLSADYFASYIWDHEAGVFTKPVFINMSPDNLALYEQHYQFRDPITHKMQVYRRAVAANEIMPQRELMTTEFFNDFLSRDGLHYGINIYVYDDGDRNIGDFRIWRSRHRDNFTDVDLKILDLIAPYFRNAMRNITIARHQLPCTDLEDVSRQLADAWALTRRETDVALAMLEGSSDKAISDRLCISLPTLRTHVQHIYAKLGVGSRAEFCSRILVNGPPSG
jgi:DNA-binding NarL/FixJ family response regulator